MTFPGAETIKEGRSDIVWERWDLLTGVGKLFADEVNALVSFVPPCKRSPSTAFWGDSAIYRLCMWSHGREVQEAGGRRQETLEGISTQTEREQSKGAQLRFNLYKARGATDAHGLALIWSSPV